MLKASVFASARLAALNARLAALRSDESGAAMIEYALVVGLVAVAAVATLQAFAGSLTGAFNAIGTHLTSIK